MTSRSDPGAGPAEVTRRRVLQGGAVAVGAWTVPVLTSVTSPAGAAGSAMPPEGSPDCRSQTFLVDRDLQPFVFEPFVLRWLDVDLGVTFASVSTLEVLLHVSPLDPLDETDIGNVILFDGPDGIGGQRFSGVNFRTPVVRLAFDPDIVPFRSAVADGTLTVRLAGVEGSFALTQVEVRVCGRLLA